MCEGVLVCLCAGTAPVPVARARAQTCACVSAMASFAASASAESSFPRAMGSDLPVACAACGAPTRLYHLSLDEVVLLCSVKRVCACASASAARRASDH